MIAGLYHSAAGVTANIHRQDVIANNLANVETSGFKRQLAAFQERPPERRGPLDWGDPHLDGVAGGLLQQPSRYDLAPGQTEQTHNPLDAAFAGRDGFLAVDDAGQRRLTRNGNLLVDRAGALRLGTADGPQVLDADGQSVQVENVDPSALKIERDGRLTANGEVVATLGRFTVADPNQLRPVGGTLLTPEFAGPLQPSDATLMPGFLEKSNVDPSAELTKLITVQRQLEANANMLKYQDATLARCVNDVAKIA